MRYDDDEQQQDFMDSVLLLVQHTRDEQLEADKQMQWKQTKRGTFYRIDSQYDNVIHIYT